MGFWIRKQFSTVWVFISSVIGEVERPLPQHPCKNFDAKAQRGKELTATVKFLPLRLLFLCVLCVKNSLLRLSRSKIQYKETKIQRDKEKSAQSADEKLHLLRLPILQNNQ
jgi:hypothetical protein